jgi:hypothetical protein
MFYERMLEVLLPEEIPNSALYAGIKTFLTISETHARTKSKKNIDVDFYMLEILLFSYVKISPRFVSQTIGNDFSLLNFLTKQIKIYHDCEDGLTPCQRKVTG